VNQFEEPSTVKADAALSVQDTVVIPAAKPEKTRKSSGKGFFQKFLKFGSKDAPEATQSSTVSSSDETSSKVVRCPGSPSPGKSDVSNGAKSSPDVVPSQTVPLSDKEVMLMNLKDCLAKRQTSVGSNPDEISPVHPRTQSSEPAPLRTPVQSVSSMPQVKNREKTEIHAVSSTEALPSVDRQSSGSSIHGQSSPSDASFSPPQRVSQELSESDKRSGSVDRKGSEAQRLEVKDLTVVTEDGGNVDCSVSTCSSDAVSPTPSDLSVEGADHHSLKRKSRADRQGISSIHSLVYILLHCIKLPQGYCNWFL